MFFDAPQPLPGGQGCYVLAKMCHCEELATKQSLGDEFALSLTLRAMTELNSPAPWRGVSRVAVSNLDSPPGRGWGWVVNNLLGTKMI